MADIDSTFASVIGWTATALSCFFFISPLNMFIKMAKTKSCDEIPYLMLLCNTGNTLLWFVYGMAGGGDKVWICNAIGLFFSTVYVIWYHFYKFEEWWKIILAQVGFLIFLGGFLAVGIYAKTDFIFAYNIKEGFGWAALVVNILMYAAPGQNLYNVFKTENHNLLPIVSIIVCFFNCIFWLIYSLTKFDAIDYKIFIANALGLVFSMIQFFIWLYYYRKQGYRTTLETKLVDEEENK